MKNTFTFICLILIVISVQMRAQEVDIESSHPGAQVDIAPFGFLVSEKDGTAHGIRWAEPRKIRRVAIEFPDNQALPELSQIRLQYWHRIWDGKPDPILSERGAGGVGWDSMDDWTNGRWIDVKSHIEKTGNTYLFDFAPISSSELKALTTDGVEYRKTLWIRVCSNGVLPAPRRFRI